MTPRDTIILGNGIIAKTLALALSKYAISSTRIAPAFPHYQNDPRSYAIAPSSLRLLKAIGLEFHEDEITRAQSVELGFGDRLQAPLIELTQPTGMFVMIDHNQLVEKLDTALGQDAIEGTVTQIERDAFGVNLPEYNLRAPLLLVAEGKYGDTLARLGFGFERFDYEQRAITAKFKTSIAHGGVARQLFEPTGPIGILPHSMSEISIVWSQDNAIADALLSIADDEFIDILQSKIGEFYGELTWVAPRKSFPLKQAIATRLTGERIALLGDSAHAIHPIAGQGLNLGLRDVACLMEAIWQAKRIGLDIGEANVLSAYKSSRKADIGRLVNLTRATNALTQSANPLVAASLDAGIGLMKTEGVQNMLVSLSDAPLTPQPPLLDGRLYAS